MIEQNANFGEMPDVRLCGSLFTKRSLSAYARPT
jgi:hypothetical protein